MRLAFSTLGCPGWSLERVATAVRTYGYEGVELRLLDGEIIPPDLAPTARVRIRQALAGLPIVALGTSCRFNAPSRAERQASEETARQYLALARDLGAPAIRVFGGQPPAGVDLATVAGWVAESLARLAPAAERLGVRVLLETHDAFSAGETVGRVLRQVDSPWVGALWDIRHPFRTGEPVAATLAALEGFLHHVHVGDGRRRPDGGWETTLLGEGEVPVREMLRALASRGYQGYLSVEWEKKWHPEIPEPEVALPQHARVLRAYLQEITPPAG